jgi:hypothetical protein
MPRENDEDCAIHSAVIPGRHAVGSPESIRRSDGYGFRARGLAPAPRNDDEVCGPGHAGRRGVVAGTWNFALAMRSQNHDKRTAPRWEVYGWMQRQKPKPSKDRSR